MKYRKEFKEEVQKVWATDMSFNKEIAKRFNISESTLSKWAKEYLEERRMVRGY